MVREELLNVRKSKKLTQAYVAERSGIKRSSYGLIELGKRNPTLKNAKSISEALNTPIEKLFPREIFFGNKCYVEKL